MLLLRESPVNHVSVIVKMSKRLGIIKSQIEADFLFKEWTFQLAKVICKNLLEVDLLMFTLTSFAGFLICLVIEVWKWRDNILTRIDNWILDRLSSNSQPRRIGEEELKVQFCRFAALRW